MKNIEILDEGPVHDVVVVAFDICSSTHMIEDLTRTDSLPQFDRLLRNLRLWLANNAATYHYVLYKFTGDGWILLFPSDQVKGSDLMAFLAKLSEKYERFRRHFIDGHLESKPQFIGLTYGMHVGPVRRIVLGDYVEFFGRVLNVACRLQSVVKDKGASPDFRCLLSRKVFNTYMTGITGYHFGPAKRTLRNVSGGEAYQCYKVDFSPTIE